jgi:hypothetical protein
MLSCGIAKEKFSVGGFAGVTAVVLVILTLLALMPLQVRAEQLDATIELFTELLPAERQDKLENLEELIEEYFCEYEWIEDFSGDPIPFSFRMYLVDESRGFEDRYGARVHVSNDYDLQYLDKESHFPYRPQEPLEHDAIVYHPLTGLLDFYAYLIIGGEMDKRATLGGDPYFKKAREVIQSALFSEYYRGWNRRQEELEAILTDENIPFRKMLAVYFRALDDVKDEELEKGRRFCRSALAMIEEILAKKDTEEGLSREQQEQIAKFFTFHYLEIADLFKEDPQGQEVFQWLIILDPQHEEVYRKYLPE